MFFIKNLFQSNGLIFGLFLQEVKTLKKYIVYNCFHYDGNPCKISID